MMVVSEIWLVPVALMILALIGVLVMLGHAHRTLVRRVGTRTPATDARADAFQARIQRTVATTAAQRAQLSELTERGGDMERQQRIMDDLDRVTEIRKRTERAE
ncbi:MAG: hypothetical protein LC793_20340 [Thermomicrobia bacterium]|nr:hypothetical protein [Thermomicrobia bacterium]